MTLRQTLWQSIMDKPRNKFLLTQNESYSYGDLSNAIDHFAQEMGEFSEGERIVIACADDFTASAIFLTAFFRRLTPILVSAKIREGRLSAIIKQTQAVAVLTDTTLRDDLQANCVFVRCALPKQRLNFLERIIGNKRKPRHSNEFLVDEEHSPERLAYLLFTSGTTAEPSGVEITEAALDAQLKTMCRLFGYQAGNCIANPTPLAHTDGLVHGLLISVYSGATLLRLGDYSPESIDDWMNQIPKKGATHFVTNPTILRLLAKQTSHHDYFAAPCFRAVISSAATLSKDFWLEFENLFSCEVFNIYGMTETVANATYAGRHEEMGEIGTIGKPVDCEVRLVDPETGEVTKTNVGEIQLKGENICRRYWQNPSRNERRFTADGWFKSGDLASWGKDGSLHYLGRADNVIVTGGLTLSPDEIDEVLLRNDKVSEAITLGHPDEHFGEIAVSLVVVSEPLTTPELMEYARRHLELLKVPKYIFLSEGALPRGPSGKPDQTAIRSEISKRLDAMTQTIKSTRADQKPCSSEDLESAQDPMIEEILAVASNVFSVPKDMLSLDTKASDLDIWDSFNHLNLILSAEQYFQVSLSTEAILNIKSLADLATAIRDA